ncbi:MAG: tetratricopeptide repeat protein [Longimicrobiales bacterium]
MSPRRPPRGSLGSLAGPIVLGAAIVFIAAGGPQDRAYSAEELQAMGAAAGGGGGAPPPDAQGDALPPGGAPARVSAALQGRVNELWYELEKRPHDGGALLRMGQLMEDAGRPRQAAHYYERYLQIIPQSQAVWLLLGNSYSAASDWRRAADASERMLARFPDDAAAMYSLGAALANQGRFEDARGWWERVLLVNDPVMMGRALRALEQLAEM